VKGGRLSPMISYCILQNYGIPLAISLLVAAVLHL